MVEKYSFFDPIEDQNGLPDREYNAQQFIDYFASLVTTGVMKGAGNELAVTANGANMITEVEHGIAFVEGRYYNNTTLLALTHDTETLGKNRIDRVVVRLDLNTEARHVRTFVRKGVASTNPVAPVLQRDFIIDDTSDPIVYEISLAQVKIIGGQTYINPEDVTDERGIEDICPWAGSNILPNFDDEGLSDLILSVESINDKLTSTNVKIGSGATNLVDDGIVIGTNVINNNNYGIVIGRHGINLGNYGIAIGRSENSGAHALTMGYLANNSSNYGIGIGYNAKNSSDSGIAIGRSTNNSGESGIAIGKSTNNSGKYGIAIGKSASANDYQAIALGADAESGYHSMALGLGTKASERYGLAIGSYAITEAYNSISIGSTSWAGENEVVIGSFIEDLNLKHYGDLTVSGTKNFEIPHPHPEKRDTHMLRHGAVESPTTGDTLYRYTIEATEDNQTVEIQLPDYFEYLNINVDVWVNPHLHFGRAFGFVEGDKLKITCEKAGTYKALVIGTRNDDNVQDWHIKGVEREVGENWLGETNSININEISTISEIKEESE
ncbi:hypothetical protein ACSVDA_16540 [Cytobacillus sp. Hm23]